MTCVHLRRIELNGVADFVGNDGDVDEVHLSHHKRDSLASIGLFQRVSDGKQFIVCNIHAFWNPAVTDVKLFQLYYFSHRLLELREEWGSGLPVIFGGDFNSMPSGSVMTLLKDGLVPKTHPEYAAHLLLRYPAFLEKHDGFRVPFCWKFALESNAFFTNYTAHFRAQIDYMLYLGDNIRVAASKVVCASDDDSASYTCRREENADAVAGARPLNVQDHPPAYPLLPSKNWPSDHLAIIVDFEIA